MLARSMRGIDFSPGVCSLWRPAFDCYFFQYLVVLAPCASSLFLPLFAGTSSLRLVFLVNPPITYDRWRCSSMIGDNLHLS